MNKESYLTLKKREYPTTLKVLRSMPEAHRDVKPGPKSKTAIELAWIFVTEERLIQALLRNEKLGMGAPHPATFAEIISDYETAHAETVAMVEEMSDEELDETAPFFVGPKTPGDIPKIRLAWMLLLDMIHHRGQFSVYLRVADAKVPSIYGPSADEPWM